MSRKLRLVLREDTSNCMSVFNSEPFNVGLQMMMVVGAVFGHKKKLIAKIMILTIMNERSHNRKLCEMTNLNLPKHT